jgi:PKHD-type hydroxylase
MNTNTNKNMYQNSSAWMFQVDNLNDYATSDNSFSVDECKKIIEIGETNKFNSATIAGKDNNLEEDFSYRKTQVSWIYPNTESEFIFRRVTDIVTNLNNLYFHFDLLGMIEGFQFTKYEAPSDFYGLHSDRSPKSHIRKLSMTIQLSDPNEYEGGDLHLQIGSEPSIISKDQGKIVCFPSYILHEVKPVTKGTRYSLVAWFTGPAFR